MRAHLPDSINASSTGLQLPNIPEEEAIADVSQAIPDLPATPTGSMATTNIKTPTAGGKRGKTTMDI